MDCLESLSQPGHPVCEGPGAGDQVCAISDAADSARQVRLLAADVCNLGKGRYQFVEIPIFARLAQHDNLMCFGLRGDGFEETQRGGSIVAMRA